MDRRSRARSGSSSRPSSPWPRWSARQRPPCSPTTRRPTTCPRRPARLSSSRRATATRPFAPTTSGTPSTSWRRTGPSRFPVVAARGGTVIAPAAASAAAAARPPATASDRTAGASVNYVLIDHGDGTSGLYLHLTPGSPLVRSGDVVSRASPSAPPATAVGPMASACSSRCSARRPGTSRGSGGWFLTESQPRLLQRPRRPCPAPDGVPQAGDTVTSANPGPARSPSVRAPPGGPAGHGALPGRCRSAAQRRLRGRFARWLRASLRAPRGGWAPRRSVRRPGRDRPRHGRPTRPERPTRSPGRAHDRPRHHRAAALRRRARLRRLRHRRLGLARAHGGHPPGARRRRVPGRARASLGDRALAPRPGPGRARRSIIGPNEYLGRYGAILAPGQAPAPGLPRRRIPPRDDLFAAILRGRHGDARGRDRGRHARLAGAARGRPRLRGLRLVDRPGDGHRRSPRSPAGRARPGTSKTPANASHVVFGDPSASWPACAT